MAAATKTGPSTLPAHPGAIVSRSLSLPSLRGRAQRCRTAALHVVALRVQIVQLRHLLPQRAVEVGLSAHRTTYRVNLTNRSRSVEFVASGAYRALMEGTSAGGPLEGHRLEFDQSLASLIQNAQQMLTAQNRLRGLLRASRIIVADLDLDTVLTRIVESACDLVEADYGALGVVSSDRSGLERFVHVGLDDDAVAAIGHLPQGRGLLGLLIDDPRPIRVADLREDPHSIGFPAHHPPMQGFLGVPISVRGEVFGNLYLTRREGKEFTSEDEELVSALAATAGTAIEHARLFEEARQRESWLGTATSLTRRVLAGEDPLPAISRSVYGLAGADLVVVAQPSEDQGHLEIAVAIGEAAEQVSEARYPLSGTLSELVLSGAGALRIADVADTGAWENRTVFLADKVDTGPALIVPLAGATSIRGVLWVTRGASGRPFSATDEAMVTTFANHAAMAWELALARQDQQHMEMLRDRDRIAQELGETVVRDLFAAGLALQGAAPRASGARESVEQVVDDLDSVIKKIRDSVFSERTSP